jgi:hypothetical protein
MASKSSSALALGVAHQYVLPEGLEGRPDRARGTSAARRFHPPRLQQEGGGVAGKARKAETGVRRSAGIQKHGTEPPLRGLVLLVASAFTSRLRSRTSRTWRKPIPR